jgi:hypothetical protein
MLVRGFVVAQLFSLTVVINCSSVSSNGAPPTPDASTTAADTGFVDTAAGSCKYRRIAATYAGRRQVEHLVIALDASATMCTIAGATPCLNPASNRRIANDGLIVFFRSAKAAGLYTSVFMYEELACTNSYDKPAFGDKVLLPFPKLEVGLSPGQLGDRPPLGPAIREVSEYAGRTPSLTTAFALLTGGAGSGACGGLASGATEITNAKNAGLAPFVLGFGGSVGDINALAQAAGTNGGRAFAINAAEDV